MYVRCLFRYLAVLLFFILSFVSTISAKAVGDSLIFLLSANSHIYYYSKLPWVHKTDIANFKIRTIIAEHTQKLKRKPFVIVRAEHNSEYRMLALLMEEIRFSNIPHFNVEEITDEERDILAQLGDTGRPPIAGILPAEGLTFLLYPHSKLAWYRNEDYPNIQLFTSIDTLAIGQLLTKNAGTPLYIKIDEKASPTDLKKLFKTMEAHKVYEYEFREQSQEEISLVRQQIELSKKRTAK